MILSFPFDYHPGVIREIGAVLRTVDEDMRGGVLAVISNFNFVSGKGSLPPRFFSSSIGLLSYFVEDHHHATIRQNMERIVTC
jgi:hypothetical protein